MQEAVPGLEPGLDPAARKERHRRHSSCSSVGLASDPKTLVPRDLLAPSHNTGKQMRLNSGSAIPGPGGGVVVNHGAHLGVVGGKCLSKSESFGGGSRVRIG